MLDSDSQRKFPTTDCLRLIVWYARFRQSTQIPNRLPLSPSDMLDTDSQRNCPNALLNGSAISAWSTPTENILAEASIEQILELGEVGRWMVLAGIYIYFSMCRQSWVKAFPLLPTVAFLLVHQLQWKILACRCSQVMST